MMGRSLGTRLGGTGLSAGFESHKALMMCPTGPKKKTSLPENKVEHGAVPFVIKFSDDVISILH